MECDVFEAQVLDLLYGELPADRRADFEGHASSCPTCGKLSKELSEARTFAALLPNRVSPPRELDERIALAARAAADRSDVRKHAIVGGPLHIAAAVLLLCSLGITSFVLGARFGKKPTPYIDLEELLRKSPGPKHTGNNIETSHPSPSPSLEAAHGHDRDKTDYSTKYNEDLLDLAKSKLERHESADALKMFNVLVTTSSEPRKLFALEARLGRARAEADLTQINDALADAEFVKATILNAFGSPGEREASVQKLLDEADQLLETLHKLK